MITARASDIALLTQIEELERELAALATTVGKLNASRSDLERELLLARRLADDLHAANLKAERENAALREALDKVRLAYRGHTTYRSTVEIVAEIDAVLGTEAHSQSPRKLPTAADVRGILCDEPMEGNSK